jgi:predicted acylesterase/phospholipase RssA
VTNKRSSRTECLTSYNVTRNVGDLLRHTKIWQACRATSAASTFFEPITIGPYKEQFIDGATGANNPIWKLWEQARAVWDSEPFEENVQCIVSIGTGGPHIAAFTDDLSRIADTLSHIATETEATAEEFRRDKPQLVTSGVYYRFNVVRGLDKVGLEETKSIDLIAAATRDYLDSEDVHPRMKKCARILSTRHGLSTFINGRFSKIHCRLE